MRVRPEAPGDADAIRAITRLAFESAPHSDGTEAAIVDALRAADALTVSLVAEDDGELIGHAAFSPVSIEGEHGGWFGLGPVSVAPERQGQRIGTALIREGLELLKSSGARGCVVLGDPAYYGRFGFSSDHALRYGDIPPQYFQSLAFSEERPAGEVAYHPAFETRA